MQTHNPDSHVSRIPVSASRSKLRPRGPDGKVMDPKTAQPTTPEARAVTPELTYARVVSPALAVTSPQPVNASMTVGGDNAERPARASTDTLSPNKSIGHRSAEAETGTVSDGDGRWTVASGRRTRTHREEPGESASRPVSRISNVEVLRNDSNVTSIIDEAAQSMSPEMLRLIAQRYAKMAEAAGANAHAGKKTKAEPISEALTGSEARQAYEPQVSPDEEVTILDDADEIAESASVTDVESNADQALSDAGSVIAGHDSDEESSSNGDDTDSYLHTAAGSSRDKGKGVDPRNWGDIEWEEGEIDHQKSALKFFELRKREQQKWDRTHVEPARTSLEGPPISGPTPKKEDGAGAGLVTGQANDILERGFVREFLRMRDRLAEFERQEELRQEIDRVGVGKQPKSERISENGKGPHTGLPSDALKIPKQEQVSSASRKPRIHAKGRTSAGGFVNSVLRGVSHQPSDDSSNSSSSDSSSSTSSRDNSDSPGDGSSSDSDSDNSGSSGESDSSGYRSEKEKRKKSKKKKGDSARKPVKGKMIVKPNPPARYDGAEDSDRFTQFVDEASRWCKLGNVPREHRVAMVGGYLDGDAKDFYNRRVRGQEHKWALRKFFRRLLKHCFSLDYLQKQRKRLTRCRQNGRSVTKHVLELESILLQIGLKKDRERVALLWDSFDEDIQEELFRFRLDPEKSSWKDVVKKALKSERFLNLEKKRKGRTNPFNNSASGSNQNLHGLSQKDKRKRFIPRRRSGVIKTAAATVESPQRENGSRAAKPQRHASTTGNSAGASSYHQRPAGPERPWERRLSPQKRADLMAKGLCLNCEEAGHIARSCPKLTTMKSKIKGKPPEFGAHGVSVRLASLGETTEVLESIGVSSLSFSEVREGRDTLNDFSSDSDADSTNYSTVDPQCDSELDDTSLINDFSRLSIQSTGPKVRPQLGIIESAVEDLMGEREVSNPRPMRIGDLRARFASIVLQECAPFPGDDGSEPNEERFLVYRIQNSEYYCILDSGTPLNILEGDEIIHYSHLDDPDFELGYWWAQKCWLAQGVHPDAVHIDYTESQLRKLGDALLAMMLIMLHKIETEQLGIKGGEERFVGESLPGKMYSFGRNHSPRRIIVNESTLLNPDLDIWEWYNRHFWYCEDSINPSGPALCKRNTPSPDEIEARYCPEGISAMSASGCGDNPSSDEWDGLNDDLPGLESEPNSDDESDQDDENSECHSVWNAAVAEAGFNLETAWTTLPENKRAPWPRSGNRKVGDIIANGAKHILELCQPYPGDAAHGPESPLWGRERFLVETAWSEEDYMVRDALHGVSTLIPGGQMLNPLFELGSWYASQLAERLGVPSKNSALCHQIAEQDSLATGLELYISNLARNFPEARDFMSIRPCFGEDANPRPSGYSFGWADSEQLESARVMVSVGQLKNQKLDLLNLLIRRMVDDIPTFGWILVELRRLGMPWDAGAG
ncbi:unnamed protein product [Mycena citricolor]|uniref:CCHC-type domain-containing protein n=1 Tax=Mycena citricolor TaxID=2018698 RepID=A0AAD2HYG7_9AGAR|nr:unnamed protein product [Mycena citricolor]